MAVKLPISPNYSKNASRYPCHGDEWPCCVCGKPIKPASGTAWLRLLVNNMVVTTETEEEIDQELDFGCHPIGESCLRRHPELKAWVSK